MPERIIAIGDIHGCAAAFDALLRVIEPGPQDRLIVVGDYIDRGPDSRTVVERLMALGRETQLAVLLGNHEEMLLTAQQDDEELMAWLSFGGAETLASYGVDHPEQLPRQHMDFIRRSANFAETDEHFFVHANYLSLLPLVQQPWHLLRWESLWQRVPDPHSSGKQAIVGHTAQRSGEVWDLGHVKCIDTYCHGGGWLTAYEAHTGAIWQADREGRLRTPPNQGSEG